MEDYRASFYLIAEKTFYKQQFWDINITLPKISVHNNKLDFNTGW